MLLLLLACHGADDTALEPVYPDIPTAACGASHDWVDLNLTGRVLDSQHDPDLSVDVEGVAGLLALGGLNSVEPVYGVETWKLRYSSQDRGEVIEASAFVVTPDVPGDYPLLVWLHPTAGFIPECGPTARGLEGAAFPMLFASLGYVVVAPDYFGMNGWAEPANNELHPYVGAEPTALASLDSARALLAFAASEELPARPDPARTVFYGVSEGGIAALVSDNYASALAPELEPQVVMAIVPATDIQALAVRGTGTFGATTAGLAAVTATLQPWYGAPELSSVLAPAYVEGLLEVMSEGCSDYEIGDPQAVEDVFAAPFVQAIQSGNWAAVEPWGCIYGESSPHLSPVRGESDAVLVLVTGEEDDLAWSPPVREDAPEYCEQGRRVLYHECAGAGHVDAAVDSLPWQIDTLAALLAGQLDVTCTVPAAETCSSK